MPLGERARSAIDALRSRLVAFSGPAAILLVLALLASLVAVLDSRPGAALLGTLLAVVAASWEHKRLGTRRLLPAATVAIALAVGAVSEPQYLRADFTSYYFYLRSLAFDRDLDFRNEAQVFEVKPQPLTPIGRWPVNGTIGAALLWSPFYGLAHGWVLAGRALGLTEEEADGYSHPYLSSTLAGTIVFAVLGAWALGSVIARRLRSLVAAIAVLAAVVTSPILFYVLVQPGMVHGLVFALACFGCRAVDDADRAASAGRLALVGLLLGLVTLVRPQAVLLGLVTVPLLVRGLHARRLRLAWLAGAAAAFLLALAPQLLAWKGIYGQWLPIGGRLEEWARQLPPGRETFFRYSGWFDPRALHLWDVLFGTDRGLFSWSPALLPGLAALPWAVRRFGGLALGGLLVVVATVWFNACLATPSAGDSFGARRFDLIVPFAAIGLAVGLDACARRPLLAPTALLGLLAAWNLGLVHLYRTNAVPFAAPLDRVARGEIRWGRALAERLLGGIAGPAGRAFVYRAFVGEYLYWNSNVQGLIDLADVDSPYLAGGWSGPLNRTGPPRYRAAFHPRSCVRFPLMVATGLDVAVRARAAPGIEGQVMSLSLNGHPAGSVHGLGRDWTEALARLSPDWALPGENLLCLDFAEGRTEPGEAQPVAAHVRRLVVHSRSPIEPTPVWGLYRPGP